MQYKGLIIKPLSPTDYRFGTLGGTPLNPGGHWGGWLPYAEDQQINGIEPCDCIANGMLNAVEIMGRFQYQDMTEWSKRFLAKTSGTYPPGNDPSTVGNTLRKKGVVNETTWPTDTTITTLAGFYEDIPSPYLTLALDFIDQYDFGYEFLTSLTPADLIAALQLSPLGVGVYAWELDPATGYYVNPNNLPAEHFVCLYDYVEGQYWLVMDSYDQNIKKLAWDFPFALGMRFSLLNQVQNLSAWETFLKQIRAILGL